MEWVLPIVTLAFVAVISNALKINYFFQMLWALLLLFLVKKCCLLQGSQSHRGCYSDVPRKKQIFLLLMKFHPFSLK